MKKKNDEKTEKEDFEIEKTVNKNEEKNEKV